MVVKLHLAPADMGELGQNQNEYELLLPSNALKELLPACRGRVRVTIDVWTCDVMFVDRCSFTAQQYFHSVQKVPPSFESVDATVLLVDCVVDNAHELAGPSGSIVLSNWHTENIAFTNTDPPKMKLIDWQNHYLNPALTSKVRMKNAVSSFANHLTQTWAKADPEWKAVMNEIRNIVTQWWEDGMRQDIDLPDRGELKKRLASMVGKYKEREDKTTSSGAEVSESIVLNVMKRWQPPTAEDRDKEADSHNKDHTYLLCRWFAYLLRCFRVDLVVRPHMPARA